MSVVRLARLLPAAALFCLAVPVAAVQRVGEHWCVFVPKGRGVFAIRQIGRGRDLGTEVEIVSGLTAEETIVVDGAFLLKSQAENAIAHSLERALTGPVARGDAGTLARHLEVMDRETVAIYRELSRVLVDDVVEHDVKTKRALKRALAPSAGSKTRCSGGLSGTKPKSADTAVTSPITPVATMSWTARIVELHRIHMASMKNTPRRRASATRASASAAFRASAFSHSTALPASKQVRTLSGCITCGVAT